MKRKRFKTFDLCNTVMMLFVFIICAYPLYFVLVYSISDPARVGIGFLLRPIGFTLESYLIAWREAELPWATLISVLRVVVGTVTTLFVTSMVAYVLSRKNLVGRKYILMFFIFTLYVSSGLIPVYILYRNMGLLGTFSVYILPGLMSVFNMLIIKTSMEALPDELTESAKMDGAGYFRIYWQIIIPLSKPVLAAIALFISVGHWNSFMDVLLFNARQPHLHTLQYVLYTFTAQRAIALENMALFAAHGGSQITTLSLRMAITIIVVIPIMAVYPFMQRFFVKGLMIGSVKG